MIEWAGAKRRRVPKIVFFSSPQPRYRLYTTTSHYLSLGKEVFSASLYREESSIGLWEKEIARRVGRKWGVATPLARMGIYLTLKALLPSGSEVILSPLTIVDVVNMVILAGMKPLFADVDETGNISPEGIKSLIHKGTGAVLVTHLFGHGARMGEIQEICQFYGVPLIEDCAQAFLTRIEGRPVGTYGVAGIFSFGMYKNLTTIFGGMVLTDHEELQKKIREELHTYPYFSLRQLIRKAAVMAATDMATHSAVFPWFTYPIFRFAHLKGIGALNRLVTVDAQPRRRIALPNWFCGRFTPFQARLGLQALERVEKDQELRLERALLYAQELEGIPGIMLPPVKLDGSHIYTYFPIRVKNRREFLAFMFQKGRDVGASPYHNCAALPCFSPYFRPCPQAALLSQELVQLPTYPSYRLEEIAANTQAIRAYFSS